MRRWCNCIGTALPAHCNSRSLLSASRINSLFQSAFIRDGSSDRQRSGVDCYGNEWARSRIACEYMAGRAYMNCRLNCLVSMLSASLTPNIASVFDSFSNTLFSRMTRTGALTLASRHDGEHPLWVPRPQRTIAGSSPADFTSTVQNHAGTVVTGFSLASGLAHLLG